MTSALIVIPTIGTDKLNQALIGATGQTFANTEVWSIIDGPEYAQRSFEILSKFPSVKKCVLPANTGKNGWYGHRILAAASFLFDHDFILYCDEDNWFLPNHVQTMVDTCRNNNFQWCHSLRKIYDANCNYICDDDCESLGKWPIYLSDQHRLVDTSTYCIKKEVIVGIASAWYSGWGGDRRFYHIIDQYASNYGCTGQATVCYRLDGNPGSVTADFFINGNQIMKQKYPNVFPWRQRI
jgi:glycosyltransferase involved in cell wall biosynthesis